MKNDLFHVINRQLNGFTKYDVTVRGIAMLYHCVDLTSVYSFTIGKFVLTSVSASVYNFRFFV